MIEFKQIIGRRTRLFEGKDELSILQKIVHAENSDIFDVLEYVSFAVKPISRQERVARAVPFIFDGLNREQKDFIEFVLSKYIDSEIDEIKNTFIAFLRVYHSCNRSSRNSS